MSWRRILLLSLVLVLLMVGGTWALLHNSDAPTRIVQRELQAALLPRTTIGGIRIDVSRGRLLGSDLRVDDPTRSGAALLQIDSASADVGFDLFGGLVSLHHLAVEGIAIDLGPQLPTPADLLRARGDQKGGLPTRLPTLELRRGTVRWTPRTGAEPLVLTDVQVSALPVAGRRDRLQLQGGARLQRPELEIQIRGEIDAATGEVRALLTTGPLAIGSALLAQVTSLLGMPPPEIVAAGQLQGLTITAHLPGSGAIDRSPDLRLAGEITGVQLQGAGLPAIVQDAQLTLRASSRNGGVATAQLRQQGRYGELDLTAAAHHWREDLTLQLRLRGARIPIDQETLKSLDLFSVGREIRRALRPTTGRGDIELFVDNPHRPGNDVELDLRLYDAAVAYHGFGESEDRIAFPLPMVAKSGRVRLRGGVLIIDDVQAEVAAVAGGGRAQMTGRIDTRADSGDETAIDIVGEDVLFCPELRSALAQLLADDGALYDRLAPSGRSAVALQIRPRRELPGGWSVEVRPTAASMQWAGFPYRLDGVRGKLQANADQVAFELNGRHGDGTLTMRGRIPIGTDEGDGPGFDAVVTLQDIAVDDDLRTACAVLAPELDQAWQMAAPTGRFAAQVKVWRPRPEDPLFHDARLDLAGLDLALPVRPWRATGLRGQMFVQGSGPDTRIDFDALRGRLEHGAGSPAELAMLGHLAFGPEASSALSFVVRDLELDQQLGDSLDELRALDRESWAALQPSGRVDLVCDHRRDAASGADLGIVVHLVDVTSRAPMLPRPAEHMTGELRIADGELRFDDVRALLGGARVQCTDGRVRARPAPDGRTEIGFTVRANGVEIDDGLANLFAGPLRQAVLDRHLRGRADVDGLRLAFELPPAGSSSGPTTTIGGRLRLYDLDMTLGSGDEGIRVEAISGVVDLATSSVSAAAGRLRGALRNCSMRLFRQPVESIDAEFIADASALTIEALQARLHGGRLQQATDSEPAVFYLLPSAQQPDGRLSAHVDFERVDVYGFLEACGWSTPPYSGQARGRLHLVQLDGNKTLDAKGNGSLTIDRADLGAVPLFTAIYAQLPAADRPRFDFLDTRFLFADRSMRLEQLEIRSALLAAKGKGSLGFDGYLDIEMKLDQLLLIPLIDVVASNIVTFDLYGYLRDLRAEKRWVTQRAPRRVPVRPMPAAPPPSEHPGF